VSLAAPSGSGRRPTWILPVLAVGTGVVTYFLIILGSTVRVTESGMGCPGWPLCYGQLGPIDRFHSLLEQSHRYMVALVTVLVVLTAVAAWTFARERRSVLIPATAALGVIAIQIALGAITVVTHNAPFTVALHLLFGLIFLAVTWITVAAVLVPVVPTVGRRLRALGYTTVAMTFLLLISGSMVVDGGATYSCPSWPFCSARGVPGPLVTIQYTHRLTVLVVSIFIVLFVMHVARRWRAIPGARLVADLVGILLLAQIAVGGLVATMSAPAVLQDLHIALAAAIWAAVVALASIGWLAAADAAPGLGVQPSDALRSGGGKSLKMGTDSSTEEG